MLHLAKIGDIKVSKIKTCTIRRMPTGKWFACFSVEMGDIPRPPWKDGSVVGIDVGLASFATLSNGEKIDNPRFFREDELALAKAQSKRDKLPKGSSLRRKASKVVARIHERIGDKRAD